MGHLFALTVGLSTYLTVQFISGGALEEYDKIPAGAGHDGAYGVCISHTSGVVVAGVGSDTGFTHKDVWIFGSGIRREWELHREEKEDCAFNIRKTAGGYIVVGHTRSLGGGGSNLWLLKIGPSGNKLWSRTFGGDSEDHGFDVRPTRDGGHIVVGSSSSYGVGNLDVYLVKTTAQGAVQWERTFGGREHETGYSVQQTSDGGYIITGYKESDGKTDTKVWLIKTNDKGVHQWDRVFGGDQDDCGTSVVQCKDGGFFVAGWTDSFGEGRRDAYVIKTSSEGKLLWARTIGGRHEDCAQSALESRGLYVFTGWTSSFEGSPATWLVAMKPDGSILWSRIFFGAAGYYGYGLEEIPTGGYVIAGVCDSADRFGRGYDGFIMTASADGWLGQRSYLTRDSRGGGPIPDGFWGFIEPGEFTVECRNVNATLSECGGASTPRRVSFTSPSRDRNDGDTFNAPEQKGSSYDRLTNELETKWIATHRVHCANDRVFDVVLLEEKTQSLILSMGGTNRGSKFPLPKKNVDRVEPLGQEQIAEYILTMLKLPEQRPSDAGQTIPSQSLIQALSEKCCKYGAPIPGATLVKFHEHKNTKEIVQAELEIDGRRRVVKKGEIIDGFEVVEMDKESNTVLVRLGKEGGAFRIWSSDMWKNLDTKPAEKEIPPENAVEVSEVRKEDEVTHTPIEEISQTVIPEAVTNPSSLSDEDPAEEPGGWETMVDKVRTLLGFDE